ncbi:MAG: outer membrane protein [Candidatus Magnetoglobus multicellularis str. Araruama]|uniref:Outer membrane protein n=1 Tax=Candidatus Magnetoglobus multicellularis str. Araruama TaxID=890399 RepID=A0A1V1P8C9_9BACT|nr:MAG: outer membrane protein [Candidatus Magnetoglobus multicellularis str. Araruama]
MKLKSYIVILVSMSVMACTTTYAWDKVGYINLQRLVNESNMGKAAKADIERLRQEKQKAIDTLLKEIQELKALIEKNGDLMGEKNKAAKLEELQKKYKKYKRMVADAKEELANEDSKLVSTILERADSVLKQVAKQEKFTIIIKDPDAIGYLDPKVDITDQVIRAFNKVAK